MTGSQTKEFLEKFIRLAGEVTDLHGRRELSKDGHELMRNMLREAMDRLSSTKHQVHGPDQAKVAEMFIPVEPSAYFHGYLKSDILAARANATTNQASYYRWAGDQLEWRDDFFRWKPLYDVSKDEMAFLSWATGHGREAGLRLPGASDYKPVVPQRL